VDEDPVSFFGAPIEINDSPCSIFTSFFGARSRGSSPRSRRQRCRSSGVLAGRSASVSLAGRRDGGGTAGRRPALQ